MSGNLYSEAMNLFSKGNYEAALAILMNSKEHLSSKEKQLLEVCKKSITDKYYYIIKECIEQGDISNARKNKAEYERIFNFDARIANLVIPERNAGRKTGTDENRNIGTNAFKRLFHSKLGIIVTVIVLVGVIALLVWGIKNANVGDQQNRNMNTSIADSIAVVDTCVVDSVTAHISSNHGAESFVYYYNARFGYRIAYPSYFTQMPEPENSDGCEIRRDEQTYILVYGRYNALEETIEDMYSQSKAEEQTTYSKLKNNWFVISGYTEDGRIFYQKTALIDDVIFTAILYYTEDENAYFSQIIPKIFSDFPD